MSITDIKPTSAALRKRAEAKLEKLFPPSSSDDPNALRLIHELQVHEIELEMQNEALQQTQRALEQQRDKYENLYDSAPVGYLTLNGTGRIVEINRTAANLVEGDRASLLNTPFTRFVCPDGLSVWASLLEKFKANDDLQTIELPLQTALNRVFFAQLHCVRHDRSATWLRVTMADISERRRADEKLRLAAIVFTNAREGILITTADGTIIEVNDSFSNISGYSRDEVIGKNPRLLGSGKQDADFYQVMWQNLTEHGIWAGEITNRCKNGDNFLAWQSITAVHDEFGKTCKYVAVFSKFGTVASASGISGNNFLTPSTMGTDQR